ncbi:ATP-binding protein [Burkholderia singularis]|uniref:histidine kinase n=1 Tax=Burkholderia singularis TaxID=1503053 RepID=A0A238H3E0_9BURK|nr:ATP-binding protein [Burkholderia singularis]SMF99760.1 Sensor histidine kinase/response regulator [Burkholderia singularis]
MRSDGFCRRKFCRRILMGVVTALLAVWTSSQASDPIMVSSASVKTPCEKTLLHPWLWWSSNVLIVLLCFGWTQHNLRRLRASLNASRGALAVASHELRGPVDSMLALVDVLTARPPAAEQQRLLGLMQESGQSLVRVLNDLLDHANLEAGQFAIEPVHIDLRELTDSVTALLAARARRKGLRIGLHIDEDVPAVVLTDGNRLRQILVNLIGNAIRYTERGSVSVRLSVTDDCGDALTIVAAVVDTGIGIAAEDLPKLFTPFVRGTRARDAQPAGSDAEQGSGLGLTVARKLARLLGGEVTLTSEVGRGTVATMSIRCGVVARGYQPDALTGRILAIDVADAGLAAALSAYARAAGMRLAGCGTRGVDAVLCDDARVAAWPPSIGRIGVMMSAAPEEEAEGSAPVRLDCNPPGWRAFVASLRAVLDARDVVRIHAAPARPAALSYRVLVVDDQAMNRLAMRYRLDALGHHAHLCNGGDEALRTLEKQAFDIVLTDCRMPGLDGLALAESIRAHPDPRVRATPVVGMTALASQSDAARCVDAGMVSCIGKPVTLERLERALVEAIEPAPVLRFDPALIERNTLLKVFGASRADLPAFEAIARACHDSLERDRDTLMRHLGDGLSEQTLRAWCHAARGTFSLFGQAHVDELLDVFHQLLAADDARAVRSEAREVLAMVGYLLSCVEYPAQWRDDDDSKGEN